MEIGKLKSRQNKPIIAHCMRGIEGGKASGNEAIDITKTCLNYSLVNRGNSVNEINRYRLQVEKEIFKYNRKDLVHSLEFVFQLPRDCPAEQEAAFFRACHDFVCEKILPMGERCVFVSQVHQDEFYKDRNGNIVLDSSGEVLSKKHLHMMAVPGVPDTKHEGYQWKLCGDSLTRKKQLSKYHPMLQQFLDDRGIKATVFQKKSGSGKTIGLSVKQLKEITAKTGITIDKSLTLDDLANILKNNRDIKIERADLQKKLDQMISKNNDQLKQKDQMIHDLKEVILQRNEEKSSLQSDIVKADSEKQNIINAAKEIIKEKQTEIDSLKEENRSLTQNNRLLKEDLSQAQERIQALEEMIENDKTHDTENTWGVKDDWGQKDVWGTKDAWGTKTEDKTW